jgi:SAM-dependent methyltransferase
VLRSTTTGGWGRADSPTGAGPAGDEEVADLVALLRGLEPARTLDVACGTGFLTRPLPGNVTGLDQSAAMIEVAARQASGATLVQGDAVPLPFPDGAFERLHTSHFYGHLLPEERAALLSEARRVAGELVVVDAAGDGTKWESTLNDGSQHQVYKRWFSGAGLADELGGGEVLLDGRWLVVVRTRRTPWAVVPV